jgi:hypothetical protein
MFITTDPLRTKTEEYKVNEVTPEGEIIKDLTLGEYDIVVTNQPERDTLEDSTFAQAAELRKDLGVAIPDSVLIQASRIPNKAEVVEAIAQESNSPEAQQQKQLGLALQQAEIGKIQSDTRRDDADSQVKVIKAQQDATNLRHTINPEAQLRIEADLATRRYETDTNAQLEREKMSVSYAIAQLNANAKRKSEPKKKETSK